MIAALTGKQTSIQKKIAIEKYIPYALGLSTAIQGAQVRLQRPITYKWRSFMNGHKSSFSHPQVNFGLIFSLIISFISPIEVAMTLLVCVSQSACVFITFLELFVYFG